MEKLAVPRDRTIVEPCAGDGAVFDWLVAEGFDVCGVEIDRTLQRPDIRLADWFSVSHEYIPMCNVVMCPPAGWQDKFLKSCIGSLYIATLCCPSYATTIVPDDVIECGEHEGTAMEWRVYCGK